MRLADRDVRGIVFATFLALLVSPDKWGFPLALISLVIVGTWGLLYPHGVLGRAKTAHPTIDVDDPSLWWIARLDGFFEGFAAILLTVLGFRR